MARRMMGIAGIAAGLALLDPEAGGGGGGSATATPSGISQEERNRIAAEASAAALKADRARVNSIRAAAVPFAGNEKIQSLANRAIDEQMTVEQFNAEAMIHLAPATLGPGPAQVGNEPTPTITAGRTQSEKLGGSLALAVMQRQQPQIIQLLRDGVSAERSSREARVAEQVAEYWGFGSAADAVKEINVAKASGLAGLSLSQMALRCVAEHARMDLAQAITRFSDSTELFRAAMQTRGSGGVLAGSAGVGSSDFPELMRNVANKTMMAAFAMKATIWEKICAEGRANDFKTAYMVGVSEIGKFVLTPESAPIPESKPVERRETIAVNKFTNGFSLTYEAMVNDDLGAFLQIPQMIGEMAKYIPDDLLITLLKANSYGGPQMQTDSTKLYDAAHKNVGTGVFNYDNVRALQLLGSKQVSRGPDAVELDVDLSVLLVPTALKMSAVDINTQRYVPGTAGQQNQENTLRGTLDLAWSNRLDTDVRYWMFTRPGPLSAFEVRFLFGQKTPTIAISNLSDLTAQRYDAMVPGVGVAARNWEGTAASTGA